MPSPFRRRREIGLERLFDTRSEAWAAAGLEIEVNRTVTRHALERLALTIPLLIATIIAEAMALNHIRDLEDINSTVKAAHLKHPGLVPYHPMHWVVGKTPVTIAAVILVLILGWLISRDLARIAPLLFRRMDPATAGTLQFIIRFVSVAATLFGALAVAGVTLQVLAVGGAFTAVVLGLAAQQTLGNLFAGMVLLSARPFRLGERVRFQAGVLGGQIDGIVSSLGLLYTTLLRGQDRFMIPNTVILTSVVMPLRDPEPVDVKVRLQQGVRPTHVQRLLDANVSTPTRNPPRVLLEEIDAHEVIVRIQATPERHRDGAKLADEIIGAVLDVTGEHRTVSEPTPTGDGD